MAKVSGVGTITKNLRLSTDILRKNEGKGIALGGLLIKKASQQKAPRRVSNLITSAFVVLPTGITSQDTGFKGDEAGELATTHSTATKSVQAETQARSGKGKLSGAVAYSAPYSVIVHENPNAGAVGYDAAKDVKSKTAKQVHSKVGGWKFLEFALKEQASNVLRALQGATKFK